MGGGRLLQPLVRGELEVDTRRGRTLYAEMNSPWTHDRSVRAKTTHRGDKFDTSGLVKDFLDATPAAQTIKEKINKLGYVEIKHLYIKGLCRWSEEEWEKYL